MKRGHVPERTCRGCGRKTLRSELIRFAVAEGVFIEDQKRQMPGKGVYCCDETVCRERLIQKRKLRKAR